MSEISITYWKFKGRNYYIQAVAQAGGIKINLVHDFNLAELKQTTLPFGQVPYMVDGDVKMAQSFGILRYVAKKAGLLGDSDAEYTMSEMLIEESNDIRNIVRDARSEDPAIQNSNYDEIFAPDGKISKHYLYLERLLRDGETPSFHEDSSKLFAGDYTLVAILDVIHMIEPSVLGRFPKLSQYYRRVFALPAFDGIRDFPLPAAAYRR